MPRKTNKTAHVLNLLSAGAPKDESETPDIKESGSNIQIVDNPTASTDPLSGLIKDSLEKEILGVMEPDPAPESAPSVDADTISEASASTTDMPEPEVSAPTAVAPEPEVPTPTAAVPEPEVSASPAVVPEPEIPAPTAVVPEPEVSTPTAVVPEPEVSTPTAVVTEPEVSTPTAVVPEPEVSTPTAVVPEPEVSAPAAVVPEPDYLYTNVMNVLVDQRLEEFMKKFDACTCERCKLDARALALSNLPPKYIVTPKASYAPLMSFYANKYQFNIVTELTKACLAIINDPRH